LTTRSDAVIVQTPGLVDRMLSQGASCVGVVPSVVTDSQPDPAVRASKRAELGLAPETCLFVYAGAVGLLNGIDVLVDAMERIQNGADLAVAVVGDGSARVGIGERLAREQIEGIQLVGGVEKAEVARWLAAADVCLHLLRPDSRLSYALPTKVLEYFGARRPFITTAPGLARRLARNSGGSVAENADALADELRQWAERTPAERQAPGGQGFAYGLRLFGRETVVDRLESTLRAAIASRGSASASCAAPTSSPST